MNIATGNSWTLGLCLLSISLATAGLPRAIFADTITIVSGNGPRGATDPVTQVSTDGGATFNAAYIMLFPSGNYSTIPGTQWIAFNSFGNGLTYTDMWFRITFQLPAGFSNPQLSLAVFADNVATGYLDGVEIGGQPFLETYANFQSPASTFTTSNAGLFHVGQNVLAFDVYNFNDPSGLDYQATITFVPEPSSAVLVGGSLFGCLLLRRKKPDFRQAANGVTEMLDYESNA